MFHCLRAERQHHIRGSQPTPPTVAPTGHTPNPSQTLLPYEAPATPWTFHWPHGCLRETMPGQEASCASIPGRVSSGATDGGPGNLGEPAEGASGATCRSASLRALAQFVGPGQHTAAAAEKSLAILPGVRKPGLASPTSAASPGVTTAGGQQVAGELRGALT